MPSVIDNSKEVLCLFGFDLEQAALLEKEGRCMVLFTPDFLQAHPWEWVYCSGEDCDLERFEKISQEKAFWKYTFLVREDLPQDFREKYAFWCARCQEIQWRSYLSASDWQDFGVKVACNMYEQESIPKDRAFFLRSQDVFSGIPAIICGAGPSLAAHVPALKTYNDKALIFAGGAALGYLTQDGISIDIAAGIDPDPVAHKVKIFGEQAPPFFYQNRFSSQMLAEVKGRKFQVPGNEHSPLEQWLDGDRSFDGGWSVVTFCAALAAHFGCNPIVLVGADFSAPLGKSFYREESVRDADGAFVWEDPHRGKLFTKADWILSARWLEDLRRRFPQTQFIHTSLEGIHIKGMEYRLFEETVRDFPEQDKLALIKFLEESWMLAPSSLERWLVLKDSLDRSLLFVETMLSSFAKHYPNDPSCKGEFVLAQLDLQEEIFAKKVLDPIWSVWQFPLAEAFSDPYALELNKLLFFKNVISEYRSNLWSEKHSTLQVR